MNRLSYAGSTSLFFRVKILNKVFLKYFRPFAAGVINFFVCFKLKPWQVYNLAIERQQTKRRRLNTRIYSNFRNNKFLSILENVRESIFFHGFCGADRVTIPLTVHYQNGRSFQRVNETILSCFFENCWCSHWTSYNGKIENVSFF